MKVGIKKGGSYLFVSYSRGESHIFSTDCLHFLVSVRTNSILRYIHIETFDVPK